MPALEPLCDLLGPHPEKLTREETILLEIDLFACICEELKNFFREQYKNYFQLIKFEIKTENTMLDANFGRLIIEDILSTNEYNLQGIAEYTDTHEDAIQEIIIGTNVNPSGLFLRKLIELHRSVRRDLYSKIIKKVLKQYTDYSKDA